MVDDSSEYYQSNDFDFETTHIYLEQYDQFENSRTSSNLSTETLPEIQTTLENKEKDKESIISKNKKLYKRKNPSFTREYFEKIVNSTGEEVRVCKVQDENRKKCNQEYKNIGSSTGNLIAHFRDVHGIVSQDDIPRNSKITDFIQKVRPHPKHIQKRREEVLFKWMILTNQSLSTVIDNAYREKMSEFNPAFVVSSEKKIRTMIVKSYKYNRENLQNLVNIAESVSLTMDFWSSKAKHEYLGITATWVTSDFEIKDNLKNHIILITTDSRANMVSTFPLLNQKDGCEKIKRLPCVAHTIQLAIRKGLASAEILVVHVKRIIHFFQTQKQLERLKEVQKRLGYTDVIDAITQLQTDLYTSIDREIKKDSSKLKRILLSDEEWELIDQLIDLLMPFEEMTREFSGNTYVTLSRVIPKVKEIIFDLASEAPPSNDLFFDEDTIFESEDAEIQHIDCDDDEIVSNITKRRISIKNPLNTT
ncbi:299_t:CDS:2, partial [Racocetra persica]